MQYRPDVDGLRAIAIAPVVLFHARVPGVTGGYVGVDIFFVISGFLITSILLEDLRQDRFSILRFYERRVRRIFPALFAVFIVVGFVAALLLMPEEFKSFGKSVLSATFFGSNFLFWTEAGYFDAPAEQKPLLHTWSLAVEEQYYIFFPICLYLTWRFFRRGMAAITIVVFFLSLAVSAWQTHTEPDAAFYLIHSRMWELLLGSALAIGLFPKAPRSPLTLNVLAAAGFAMIGWSVFAFTRETPFPGLHALLPCGGAALIIYAGMGGRSVVGRLLSTAPFVFVGKISYSLYLWHWPLLVFAGDLAIRDLRPAETAGVLALSVLLATLSWRYIETPFRERKIGADQATLFRYAGAAMAASVFYGVVVIAGQGLPDRLSKDVQVLAAGAKDRDPRRKCTDRDANDVRRRKLCRLGKPDAPPTFVIWGDSHAAALLPAVDKAAHAAGRNGYIIAFPACPALIGVGRMQGGYNSRCIELGEAVEQFLRETPSIDTVILHCRWALYTTGSFYEHEKKFPEEVRITDRQSAARTTADNAGIFTRNLEKTIRIIADMGRTPVVVAGIPEIGWDAPSVLARAKLQGWDLAFAAPARDDYLRRQSVSFDAFAKAQDRYGARVYYPHKYLCADTHCNVVLNGRPMYYDTNHISMTGARLVEPMFEAIFNNVAPTYTTEQVN